MRGSFIQEVHQYLGQNSTEIIIAEMSAEMAQEKVTGKVQDMMNDCSCSEIDAIRLLKVSLHAGMLTLS